MSIHFTKLVRGKVIHEEKLMSLFIIKHKKSNYYINYVNILDEQLKNKLKQSRRKLEN